MDYKGCFGRVTWNIETNTSSYL